MTNGMVCKRGNLCRPSHLSFIFCDENINDKWDGLHKGQPVPIGVYNYEVLAYGKEFGQVHRSGNVTVVN